MINKMINKTIFEIIIIILFTILSIPVWNHYRNNINLANSLVNENKLKLAINNVDGYDNVIVENKYTNEEKYRLLLITEKDCDYIAISINKQNYLLKDFPKEKKNNHYVYTLATDYIKSSRKGYKIMTNLKELAIIYSYKLEELTYF